MITTNNRNYWHYLLMFILVIISPFPKNCVAGQTDNSMVLIPSGKLIVSKRHRVTEMFIDKFFKDRFEVTQESYETIMRNNPSFFKDRKRPIEKINWFEAVEYCHRTGKRLPSEWEWEWAARAGSISKFYFEKENAQLYGWFKKNSEQRTQRVGKKKPNAYGLFDMSGNVWEWTNSYREATQGKVLRGGSWRNSMNSMGSSNWITSLPIHKFHYVGFRCASSDPPAGIE